jgi:hypothetical protein
VLTIGWVGGLRERKAESASAWKPLTSLSDVRDADGDDAFATAKNAQGDKGSRVRVVTHGVERAGGSGRSAVG